MPSVLQLKSIATGLELSVPRLMVVSSAVWLIVVTLAVRAQG